MTAASFSATKQESFWPARIAVLSITALQITLNERVTLGANWMLPALELLLLVPLSVVREWHMQRIRQHGGPRAEQFLISHGAARVFSFLMIGLLNLANLCSLLLLVQSLLHGSKATGKLLLLSALNIWFTNIIVYALWYWELDRGGPLKRRSNNERHPDWLFPQMTMPTGTAPGESWRPTFTDYLFLAFTNATAFSPTDTLPLSALAKVLMMVQAGISLLTIALVASRAVNILS